ncbi:MAG: ABC transporter permease subunit [Candidatus Wallbacteria bacterium]|nr:ABC transporter permease subunit [Candidatus Wallbacteria bacterium]
MEKLRSGFFSPVFLKRLRKFRSLKRGYYSFILIVCLYIGSFFAEFFVNGNALYIVFEGKRYFTLYNDASLKKVIFSRETELRQKATEILKLKVKAEGQEREKLESEHAAVKKEHDKARELKKAFGKHRNLQKYFDQEKAGNRAVLVFYHYGPNENLLDELGDRNPPTSPDRKNWFGTDDRGRDVFARMVYGFRISMSFALILTAFTYTIGITVGSILGYFGGKIDFFGVRLIEIWSAVPFLYTVMIVSSIIEPNFILLIGILTFLGWMGMSYYIRAEFLREKSKDYVLAAIAVGVSDPVIMLRHIFPNALTPVISFLPFSIVGGISSLVTLDFLGFGLPVPTPSWGELLSQASANIHSWWLMAAPVASLFLTLLLITFIGEAIREAFDPKVFSRLR